MIFSIHAYADWREETPNNSNLELNYFYWKSYLITESINIIKIKDYGPYDKNLLAEIVKKGIPLMLGEFSDKHPDSNKVEKYMNAPKLMK